MSTSHAGAWYLLGLNTVNWNILKQTWVLLFFIIIFMACVCSQCDAHTDWLIVGHYSSVMPMGRLWAYKRKKSIMKKIIVLIAL